MIARWLQPKRRGRGPGYAPHVACRSCQCGQATNVQPPMQSAASQERSAAGAGEGETKPATFQCHCDTGLRNLTSWFTNGWAADAASAFASCRRHVSADALGSEVANRDRMQCSKRYGDSLARWDRTRWEFHLTGRRR
jgi:hypothetical protein